MDKIDNKHIVKIGIVVRDIESVAKRYGALFQIDPPTVKTPDPTKIAAEGTYKLYHGENRKILLKSCIVNLDPIYLEIVEPYDDTPSPWLDYLNKFGPGVCFISFYIHDFEFHKDLMEKGGYPLAFIEEKGFERYAYFDTQEKLGVTIEMKERD
ncbi:MAG TPA: VOC family protein [Clostridia bacterium]